MTEPAAPPPDWNDASPPPCEVADDGRDQPAGSLEERPATDSDEGTAVRMRRMASHASKSVPGRPRPAADTSSRAMAGERWPGAARPAAPCPAGGDPIGRPGPPFQPARSGARRRSGEFAGSCRAAAGLSPRLPDSSPRTEPTLRSRRRPGGSTCRTPSPDTCPGPWLELVIRSERPTEWATPGLSTSARPSAAAAEPVMFLCMTLPISRAEVASSD